MEKLKDKKIICYIIILIIAVLMCKPLFQKGISVGHDGEFHMSRVIGTLEQLKNGESLFVVARFSNGMGFGWNLFYPPISTVTTLIFELLTNNIVIAMKCFIFCTIIFSGIFMFSLVNTITENKCMAVLASALYMTSPYRLLNVYTRLAVGEMLSFVFIPIILRGVYLIFKGETNKSYLYVLGTIGLILSHNISTMLTCILGASYVLMNIKKLKDKEILKTLIVCTIIIILSVLFFEVPLLEQKRQVDYEVFRYGKMYSRVSVPGHSLNPLQLLYRNANGAEESMYFCIGLPILLALLLTPYVIKRLDPNVKREYKFLLIAGIISAIMTTCIFPWIAMPDVLLMIQFPWRMLVFVTFCFSIIAGINIAVFLNSAFTKIKDKYKNIILVVFVILSCIYSLSFIKSLYIKDINNEYFQEEEYIDTTWESSKYSSYLEYWPQKAVKSIHYIIEHDGKIHILSGNTNIVNEAKENGTLTFNIENLEEDVTLELPYLFYKGYKVEYREQNSDKIQILDIKESEHGMVEINLKEGTNGAFKVSYHATTLHKICIIISFATIIIYNIYLLINYIKRRRRTK